MVIDYMICTAGCQPYLADEFPLLKYTFTAYGQEKHIKCNPIRINGLFGKQEKN